MNSTRGWMVFIGLGLAFVLGWTWVVNKIWPPPPPKPKPEAIALVKGKEIAAAGATAGTLTPTQEAVLMVVGGMGSDVPVVTALGAVEKPIQESVTSLTGGVGAATVQVARLKLEGIPREPEVAKVEPAKKDDEPQEEDNLSGELIAIGRGDQKFYVQALLNTRGGSVQQVILPEFQESDRLGLGVAVNGKPVPLHLVPGVHLPKAPTLREEHDNPSRYRPPELQPGKYDRRGGPLMTPPSFLMFHYDKPGDERPVDALGKAEWTVRRDLSDTESAEEQRVVFEAKLDEPHNLVVTKTYTLKPKDYHVGLKIDIRRQEGKKGASQFRYQLTGANGLPIEGEWYTTTFRQAIVGFGDDRGNVSRYIEDAPSVRRTEGGDRQTRTDKLAIRYAAVAVQYFASAVAVDDEQENRKFLEFVRATPVYPKPPLKTPPGKGREPEYWDTLDDITVRAITESFNPEQTTHKYLLYHGPVKVRLLGLMPDNKAVPDALVSRYTDKLALNTLTDAPMPNFIGRVANTIFWSDLVIFFTNIVHQLIYVINQVVPSLGVSILIVTLIVRGMLFPLSRRQAHNGMVMQAKMAKLQPELRKIQEKYAGDYNRINQEKMRLYREHHVNPLSAMGGCFMLLLQMPIFMGLYYALQESVFFRLAPFLWIPNLAAPDMLVYWSEKIPIISEPSDMGSTFYLGPFFNVLPVVAVSLMLYQQQKMMPKSDDPQVQSQQRMMKFMMIAFGFFFYKVAAGLCLYFIASTLWGLLERKLAPKPVKPEEVEDAPPAPTKDSLTRRAEEPDRPLNWWGRKKKEWRKKWEEILDQAQKQAEYRRDQGGQQQPPRPPQGGGPRGPDGGGGKKKKKKR